MQKYIISHHVGMYNRTVIRVVERQCGSPCNVSVFEGGTDVVKQFSDKHISSKTPFLRATILDDYHNICF